MTRGGPSAGGDRGSASIWVLCAGALVVLLGVVSADRALAVLARHRAEAAADLAALGAAGRIGVAADSCVVAGRVARANGAIVQACVTARASDGRSGVVRVVVGLRAALPLLGARLITASARAGRLPAGQAALSSGSAARDRGG